MRSMTGFASKTGALVCGTSKVSATVNIKSVNARFFECICKLPYALLSIETDIIKLLRKRLMRGNLFVTITVDDQSVFKGSITPSLRIAQGYVDVAAQLQQATGVSGSLTVADLLTLPHVFNTEEQLLDTSVKDTLMQLVDSTCTLFIAEAEQEGKALHDDLHKRSQALEHNIRRIEGIHGAFMLQRKQDVLQEIQSYTPGTEQTTDIRKASLYTMLDKIDIHEEIIRLKTHLHNFERLIAGSESELGKRLDFTLQELGREINTIAAKSVEPEITTLAIDSKVEIEKAREQVQNIV